ADAAKQAGIGHYVYTSVGSAHRNTRIPHFESKWKVEEHIRKIGLPATILRPVWFMENFTTFAKPSPEGLLMLPMKPARKLAMVALKLLVVIGLSLMNAGFGSTLGGPKTQEEEELEAINWVQIALDMSKNEAYVEIYRDYLQHLLNRATRAHD
ncbi:MAG: NmrA family NAD(P)-binding protein, partial [Nitrospiraceae bacterium]|nr:NmrA family NAD(P)-binding protein [Nitrospiraceae bacterium]